MTLVWRYDKIEFIFTLFEKSNKCSFPKEPCSSENMWFSIMISRRLEERKNEMSHKVLISQNETLQHQLRGAVKVMANKVAGYIILGNKF